MNLDSELSEASRQIAAHIEGGREESAYEFALKIYRRNPLDPAVTEFFVAALLRLKRDLGLAASLAKEIALRFPQNIRICSLAVHCLINAGRAEDADQLLRASLLKEPDDRLLRLELIFCLFLQGQVDEAGLALKSLAVDHPMPEIDFHSAWLELYGGNFIKGFQGIAMGRGFSSWGAAARKWPFPEWNGSSNLQDKDLFVILEGGFGDFFVTLAAMAALKKRTGAHITVAGPETFHSVIKRTPGVMCVINYSQLSAERNGVWVAGLDLSKLLGPGPIFPLGPFLKAEPGSVKKWCDQLVPSRRKFKKLVGLRFSGEATHELNLYRSMNPSEVAGLIAKMPSVGFVGLYPKGESIHLPGEPENYLDCSEELESWDDTLGLLESLDGVMSTCTSAAHAAAALGVPVLVLTLHWSYHVWTQKSKENFYYGPHVHVLRQKRFRDWAGLFASAAKEINGWKN